MQNAQADIVLKHVRGFIAAGSMTRLTDGQLLERFTTQHEEAAFAALVRRHGPLVLGVCRRLLHNWHDAEDAFQATFWVLARKAGTIGKHDSVGSWLYQVAYHTALKARTRAVNREKRERQAGASMPADPLAEVTGRELMGVLDEALQELPERLRSPLVLCYLEGQTRDEAARQLGWSLGTFKRRLEQGKEGLRKRLARRGLALPAALFAAGLTPGGASALPPLWAAATAQAAVRAAAGEAAGAWLTSTGAAALAEGALKVWSGAKIKLLGVGLLLAGLLALGAGLFAHQVLAQRSTDTPAPARANGPAARADDPKVWTVSGKVTDASGRALAGAQVTVVGRANQLQRGGDFSRAPLRVLGQAKTDAAGMFRLAAARTKLANVAEITVFAGAARSSFGWSKVNPDAQRAEIAIQLLGEQAIRGRLVDLQGQPARGVKVYVTNVGQSANGMFNGVGFRQPPREVPQWPTAATTDASGRFTVQGVNRSTGVVLQVSDDRFAPQQVGVPKHPKEIAVSLAPAQTIEGTVVYGDTSKPVPHARLTVYSKQRQFDGAQGLDGRADANGRFRLNPYAGKFFDVAAYAPDGEPYLTLQKEVAWPKGAVKQQLRLALPAGVLVHGKVTEAPTGKPVANVSVTFEPLKDNNKFLRNDVIVGWPGATLSGLDGVFQIPVLPGPGHLLVCGPNEDYVHVEVGSNVLSSGKPGGMRYQPDALVKLQLDPGVRKHEVAVTLRRGVTVKGKVVGPDGKQIAGGLMICKLHVPPYLPYWRFPVELRSDRFELRGLDPTQSYSVYFLDPKNRWGAAVNLSGKQAGKSVTVKLAPCGQATARFINQRGEPIVNLRPWIEIVVSPGPYRLDSQAYAKGLLLADGEYLANVDRRNYWNGPATDAKGRITFPALIPGVTYRIIDFGGGKSPLKKEFTVESGKTKALGDIPLQRNG